LLDQVVLDLTAGLGAAGWPHCRMRGRRWPGGRPAGWGRPGAEALRGGGNQAAGSGRAGPGGVKWA
jgi:hypothetical protein